MDDTSSTSSSRSSDSPTEGLGGAISPEEGNQKASTCDVTFSEGGIQPPPLAYKSKGYPSPVSPETASSVKKCLWDVDREQVDRSLRQELSRIMHEENLIKSAKWNYDFKEEKPLKGGWTWEPAKDPPKFFQDKEVGQKGSKRKRYDEDASSSSSGVSAGATVRNISTSPLIMIDPLLGESSSVSVSSSMVEIRPQKKLCTEPPLDNVSKKSDSSTNVSCASTSIPVDSSLRPSSTSAEPGPTPSQILPLPSSASAEPIIEPSSISSTESVVMSSSSPIGLKPTSSSTAPKAPSPSPSSSVIQSTAVTVSQTHVDVISSSGDSHFNRIIPITESISSSSPSTSSSSSSNSPSSSNVQNRSLSQTGIAIPATSFYQSNVDPPNSVSSSKRRKSSPGSSSSSTASSSHHRLNCSSRSSNGGSSSSSNGSGPGRSRDGSSSRRSTTSGWLKYFR